MNSQERSLTIRGISVDLHPDIVTMVGESSLERQLKRGVNWALRQVTDRFYQIVEFRVIGSSLPEDFPEKFYLVFHEGAYCVRLPK